MSDWSSDVCSSDLHATQASLSKVFDLRRRDLAGEGALGIGALVALVYTAGGLMQLVGGWLADRYPLKPIYLSAFVLQVPVMALIASIGSLPLIALSIMTVILSAAALPRSEERRVGRECVSTC